MILANSDADSLPTAPGAYLLLIQSNASIILPERFRHRILPEVRYAYAGSAYGPGGIRARCRRHLDRQSKCHWHIDWLTSASADINVMAFPGGSECHLIETLAEQDGVHFPIQGFGSTDCRQCRSHLVQLYEQSDFDNLMPKLSLEGHK